MFGYIQPDMPYLYGKDATLYKAMYCGLCKSIGASCGSARGLLCQFDMTFLSALLHNIMNTDVHIEKAHCVLHPIVKRPVAGTMRSRARSLASIPPSRTINCPTTLRTNIKERSNAPFSQRAFESPKTNIPRSRGLFKGAWKNSGNWKRRTRTASIAPPIRSA